MCLILSALISCTSLPIFADRVNRPSNSPAPEYENTQGLPTDVEYNSNDVPILGKNLPAASGVIPFYTDYDGSTTYRVNGYTIPFPSYPVNSIWGGSEECAGFAKYVYNTLWSNRTGSYFRTSTSSKDAMQSLLSSLKNGTRFTGWKNNVQKHTMVLVSETTDGVIVYHANYSTTNNKVTLTKFTYSELSMLFNEISGYHPPA